MLFRNDKHALTSTMSGSINNCSRSVLRILTKKDSPLIPATSSLLIVKPWRISSTDCRMISFVNEFTKASNVALDENEPRNDFKIVETSNGFKSLDSFARCAIDSQADRNKAERQLLLSQGQT